MARTVVLLTASWCPRCPAARRVWEQLKDRFRLSYRELDIDTQEGQEILEHYAIQAVPAVILDGRVWSEVLDEAQLIRSLEVIHHESQSSAFT